MFHLITRQFNNHSKNSKPREKKFRNHSSELSVKVIYHTILRHFFGKNLTPVLLKLFFLIPCSCKMSNNKPGLGEGGYVAASAELKRVKCSASATIEWNIPNFISLFESKDQNAKTVAKKTSPTFAITCGQIQRQFQLYIQTSTEKECIKFYLRKLSGPDVEVQFHLKAISKSGTNFGIGGSAIRKFTKDSISWGYEKFLCIQKFRDQSDDCLHNGSLKLGCELTISDDEVSMEGYDGKKLRTDLENLQRDQTVSDFKVNCKDQVFPCHKTILAARYKTK